MAPASQRSAGVPAVHRDGARIQNALLLQVDLLQEVQHAAGVSGDAVVRPGPEVVLPDGAFRVALRAQRPPLAHAGLFSHATAGKPTAGSLKTKAAFLKWERRTGTHSPVPL